MLGALKKNKIRRSPKDPRPERQKRIYLTCPACKESFWVQRNYLRYVSDIKRICCSHKCAGKIRVSSTIFQRGHKPWNMGLPHHLQPSFKPIKKKYERHLGVEYDTWRNAILRRDDFTCNICGQRGGKLEAHHLKPWATYPEMRYVVENGVVLCHQDHLHSLCRCKNPMREGPWTWNAKLIAKPEEICPSH